MTLHFSTASSVLLTSHVPLTSRVTAVPTDLATQKQPKEGFFGKEKNVPVGVFQRYVSSLLFLQVAILATCHRVE